MPVPNSFANVTTSIPLSQLDANFNTPITLGNTAIQLGNTVTTLNNMTLANVTISSGNVTITNVSVTTANVTTANITTAVITTANVATANVTTSQILNYGTANGVAYLNTSKALTTGTALVFDGTNMGIGTASPDTKVMSSVGSSGSGVVNALRLQNVGTTIGDGARILFTAGTSTTGAGIASTGVALNSADLRFYTGGSNQNMTLDASGNLGLGVTPSAWRTSGDRALQIGSWMTLFTDSGVTAELASNTYVSSANQYVYANNGFATRYRQYLGQHEWYTAASGTANTTAGFTQMMTLDTSSNLSVGRTSALDNYRVTFEKGNDKHLILNATTSGNGVYTTMAFANQSTARAYLYWFSTDSRFYVQNNTLGVYLALNGTAWTSNSDERLKTDLVPISDAMDKVSTLRSVTGRYIDDEEGVSRSFLIAQDVQAVFPQAVDADDPEKLGVRYTDTIPLLVAAIKELNAKVEAQAAEIAALKGNA